MDKLDELTVAFLDTHPREAARELERLPPAAVSAVIAGAPARVLGPVLAAMQSRAAAAALLALDSERAVLALGNVRTAVAAAMLRHVPVARRGALLDALPSVTALACRALLRFPEDAVGAFTNTQMPTFDEQSTLGQALEAIRKQRDDCEGVLVIDLHQRLRGWVPAGRLLNAGAALPLSALTQPIARLPALMPLAAAVSSDAFAEASVAAVVEYDGRLLGCVTLSELRRALSVRTSGARIDSDADMVQLIGIGYWRAVAGLILASVGLLFNSGQARR